MKNIAITFLKIGKTCKQISYETKLKENKISNIYRQNYKSVNNKYHYLQKSGNPPKNLKSNYEKWIQNAKKQEQLCKKGSITLGEFEQWIKNNKNWFYN